MTDSVPWEVYTFDTSDNVVKDLQSHYPHLYVKFIEEGNTIDGGYVAIMTDGATVWKEQMSLEEIRERWRSCNNSVDATDEFRWKIVRRFFSNGQSSEVTYVAKKCDRAVQIEALEPDPLKPSMNFVYELNGDPMPSDEGALFLKNEFLEPLLSMLNVYTQQYQELASIAQEQDNLLVYFIKAYKPEAKLLRKFVSKPYDKAPFDKQIEKPEVADTGVTARNVLGDSTVQTLYCNLAKAKRQREREQIDHAMTVQEVMRTIKPNKAMMVDETNDNVILSPEPHTTAHRATPTVHRAAPDTPVVHIDEPGTPPMRRTRSMSRSEATPSPTPTNTTTPMTPIRRTRSSSQNKSPIPPSPKASAINTHSMKPSEQEKSVPMKKRRKL